ncbi:MAG: hypothetical protein KAI81_01215 [Candidatus Marinimicrobia bacterium]|nr:hypothetical protein [Candidatus Neomarinimicrobiota bacterium]
MPLNDDKYLNLSDDEVAHIDQYLYRFAKLQDTMGERLFKNVLLVLGEKLEEKSFIDIFNRLDQLKIIKNYGSWLKLRAIRNELSHDYNNSPEINSIKLNEIFDMKDSLLIYLTDIEEYISKKQILTD